jgi:hypothetical protein
MLSVEWSRGVSDAWSDVATFIPKFLAFLIVLVIGYFVAKVIARIVAELLQRVGFDNLVERGGVGRAMANSQFDASDILAKIVFWALMLIVLQLAFGLFGSNPVSDMIAGVVAYLPKVIAAILIIVIACAIAAAVRELIDASIGGLSYGPLVANVAAIAIVVFAAFAALDQLEIAPAIVHATFYALVAIIAGSAIIAIGGGGIVPLRRRWEHVLQRWDEERPRLQQEMQGARERIDLRRQERTEQLRQMTQSSADDASLEPDGEVGARSSRR